MERLSHKERVRRTIERIKRGEYTSHERIIMRALSKAPVGMTVHELLATQTISRDRLEYVLTALRRAGIVANAYKGGPLGRWCTPDRIEAAKAHARLLRYGPGSNDPSWASKREQNRRAKRNMRLKKERRASPAKNDSDMRQMVTVVSAKEAPPLQGLGPCSVFHLAA